MAVEEEKGQLEGGSIRKKILSVGMDTGGAYWTAIGQVLHIEIDR